MSNDIQNVNWPGWEAVRLIGRGSFGAVYEIQRKVFKDTESAALKVISIPQNSSDIEEMYNDGYDDESITSTFQSHLESIVAEYSLMRKMNGSANIVNCEDVRYVQHDDGIGWDIFIKMELLTPLAKSLSDPIDDLTVIKIAKDMCAALELCKKHDVIHRDIKPQNIFVSPNGDYKLGDFGIAKVVEKTMGGTKIGTYKYMAPEVYNNQPYGASADIYSLGLVLYWLLNDRRMPFLPPAPEKLKAGMEETARIRRLNGEQIPAPAHGSEQLNRVVLKACAFDLHDRYRSATEMLLDINSLGMPDEVSYERQYIDGETTVDEFEEEAAAGIDSQDTVKNTDRGTIAIEPDNQGKQPRKRKISMLTWLPLILVGLYLINILFDPISLIKRIIINDAPQESNPSVQTTGPISDGECEHDWVAVENNEFELVTFRHIPVVFSDSTDDAKAEAHQRAQEIIAEWQAAGSTEEAFVQLHAIFAPDGSTGNGGLVMNAGRVDIEDNIETWLFDELRVKGDFGLVETGTGYELIYYLSGGSYRIDSNEPAYCSNCNKANGEYVALQTTSVESAITKVVAGAYHNLALYSDGTVRASGVSYHGEGQVNDWTGIVDISATDYVSVGLRNDGTVVVTGNDANGKYNVSDWNCIVAIASSSTNVIGVRQDGTVVATGNNDYGQCNTESWTDITQAAIGTTHAVGLKTNGTVVAIGDNEYGQCNVSDWTDIVCVKVAYLRTIGLKADGTVVATGGNFDGECNVSDWSDIIAIDTDGNHTVGLKSDGTVVATGFNTWDSYDACKVEDWSNIVYVDVGFYRTIGLKADGSIVIVGWNDQGQCDIDGLGLSVSKIGDLNGEEVENPLATQLANFEPRESRLVAARWGGAVIDQKNQLWIWFDGTNTAIKTTVQNAAFIETDKLWGEKLVFIRHDGSVGYITIYADSQTYSGEINVEFPASIVDVVLFDYSILYALDRDGTLYECDLNRGEEGVKVDGIPALTQFQCTEGTSSPIFFGRGTDGNFYGWGYNGFGSFCDSDRANIPAPVKLNIDNSLLDAQIFNSRIDGLCGFIFVSKDKTATIYDAQGNIATTIADSNYIYTGESSVYIKSATGDLFVYGAHSSGKEINAGTDIFSFDGTLYCAEGFGAEVGWISSDGWSVAVMANDGTIRCWGQDRTDCYISNSEGQHFSAYSTD